MTNWLRRNSGSRTAFDEQLRWLFSRRLQYVPGERFEYSNANYLLLGAIIEEAAGKPYERYCKDAVLTPLGARDGRNRRRVRFDQRDRLMTRNGRSPKQE